MSNATHEPDSHAQRNTNRAAPGVEGVGHGPCAPLVAPPSALRHSHTENSGWRGHVSPAQGAWGVTLGERPIAPLSALRSLPNRFFPQEE